jgi:hypothetical protein
MEVNFRAYRQYEAMRVDVSNALMALLAGAQLASHLLLLNKGSARLLPEIYPQVPHIRRVNLTGEATCELLEAAETHLGAMGVPYALAIHEDHLKTCVSLLERASLCPGGTAENTVLARAHSEIERATGNSFNTDSLTQLTTLRLMRNCTIHSGGRASQTLINQIATWPPNVEINWRKLRIAALPFCGLTAVSLLGMAK